MTASATSTFESAFATLSGVGVPIYLEGLPGHRRGCSPAAGRGLVLRVKSHPGLRSAHGALELCGHDRGASRMAGGSLLSPPDRLILRLARRP